MSADDRSQLERNRYFYGKLMTPRDMEAEQEFHRNRLNTLARNVAGVGIVHGLTVSGVRELREDDGTVELGVTVEPGVAIDSDGRLLVLTARMSHEFTVERDVGEVSVSLRYRETETERVPIPDLGRAVREGCEFNRLVESPEVTPDGKGFETKPIPAVELDVVAGARPTGDTDSAAPIPDPGALARSYRRAADGTSAGRHDSVYLGTLEPSDEGWTVAGDERRAYVYTNDMLYAALVRNRVDFESHVDAFEAHLQDFENLDRPTGSGGGRLPEGFRERVEELVSRVDELDGEVEELRTQVERGALRTGMLERYVIDRSLEEAIESFEAVAEEFDSEAARDIADTVYERIGDRPELAPDEYMELVGKLLELEVELASELRRDATESSLKRYQQALETMEDVWERERERDEEEREILRVVLAQDRVNETAGWLLIRLAAVG